MVETVRFIFYIGVFNYRSIEFMIHRIFYFSLIFLLLSKSAFPQNIRCGDGKPQCYGDTIVDFTFTPERVCPGGSISFTNTTQPPPESQLWLFCGTGSAGSGCSSWDRSPSHLYDFSLIDPSQCNIQKLVQLEVTYSNGRKCCTQKYVNLIDYKPEVIVTGNEFFCPSENNSYKILDASTNCQNQGFTSFWRSEQSGPISPNSTDRRLIISSNNYPPGIYTLVSNIDNSSGCIKETQVTINSTPIIDSYTLNGSSQDIQVCNGQEIVVKCFSRCHVFTMQDIGTLIQLDGAGIIGFNNDNSFTIKYNLPNYTYTAQKTISINNIEKHVTVNINPDFTAPATVCKGVDFRVDDITLCRAGLTTHFNYGIPPEDFVRTNFWEGSVSMPAWSIGKYNSIGEKKILMWQQNPGTGYRPPEIEKRITVIDVQPSPVTGITGPKSICPGQNGIIYTAEGNINGAVEWNIFNEGISRTYSQELLFERQQNNTITLNASPNFVSAQICAKNKNACGTSNEYCINIVTNRKLSVPEIRREPCPDCRRNEVKYSAYSQGATATTVYNWIISGNSQFIQPYTLVEGSYSVDNTGRSTIKVKRNFGILRSGLCVSAEYCNGTQTAKACTIIRGTGVLGRGVKVSQLRVPQQQP